MMAGRKIRTGVRSKDELLGQNNHWCNCRGAGSISYVEIVMSSWNIDFDKKTATSINDITCKLTEVEPDVYRWICTNPKDIPPDDLDDVILNKMIQEADGRYRWELNKLKG